MYHFKTLSKIVGAQCIAPMVIIFLLLFGITACTKDNINVKNLNGNVLAKPAPVVEGWHEKNHKHDYYIVQKWDSLYSLAWSFQVDYRDLIKINHLQYPYKLRAGQRIYMSNVAGNYNSGKAILPAKQWFFPVKGKIVQNFSAKSNGIEISGKANDPIIATAAGKVVYTGSAIPGMGRLIIIKHNDDYFSAYALNQTILVTENQQINAGQKIALMGLTKNGGGILHFEIRCNGQPQDPLKLLNAVYVPKIIKTKPKAKPAKRFKKTQKNKLKPSKNSSKKINKKTKNKK